MAEGIARKILGPNIQVESAGTHPNDSDPPAENGVITVRSKFGVDISSHRARGVPDLRVADFDYIVPLADVVEADLRKLFPELRGSMVRSWGIDDPYLGDLQTYEETATEIEKHMLEFSAFLKERA